MKDIEELIDESFAWIQKDKELFIEGTNYGEFAYYGWGGLSNQLYGYMEGYKRAADILVNTAIESKAIHLLDTLVFPICFCYRQYLELALKSLYLNLSADSKDEKVISIKKNGHSLEGIWNKVKPIIEKYSSDDEKEDIKVADTYIRQFDFFDKDSFSFRYPITKRLQLIHSKWKYLDLPNLKNRMNELYIFLNAVEDSIDHRQDMEKEFMTYFDYIITEEYT